MQDAQARPLPEKPSVWSALEEQGRVLRQEAAAQKAAVTESPASRPKPAQSA